MLQQRQCWVPNRDLEPNSSGCSHSSHKHDSNQSKSNKSISSRINSHHPIPNHLNFENQPFNCCAIQSSKSHSSSVLIPKIRNEYSLKAANSLTIFQCLKSGQTRLFCLFMTIFSHLLSLCLLLSLLATSTSAFRTNSFCPEIYQDRCKCGIVPYYADGRPTYVTNCTGSRFNDTKILAHVPTETEVLIFNGNNFTELPANLFNQTARYDRLHVVDLSNNHIRRIHGKAFHNMKSVRTFHLSQNNLSVIGDENGDVNDNEDVASGSGNYHPRMFASLKNLEELFLNDAFDRRQQSASSPALFMRSLWQIFNQSQLTSLKSLSLEHNDLSTLGPNEQFFCTLPELQRLSLAHNRLVKYRLNASCLPLLNHVDFSGNYIETIDNRSLALIGTGPASYHLNLSENPFRCDCRMRQFFLFVRNLTSPSVGWPAPKLERSERFRCSEGTLAGDDHGESARLFGKYFDDLSEKDFSVCSKFTRESHGPSGLVVLDDESAIQPDDDPETIRHKSEALRRYRRYITLSYLVLVFLLGLLVCLIGILIYTNRDYLLGTWNFFLMELNAKRDYTALGKETGNSGSAGSSEPGSSGQAGSSSSDIAQDQTGSRINGKAKRNNRYRGFGGKKQSVRIAPIETMVAEVQV